MGLSPQYGMHHNEIPGGEPTKHPLKIFGYPGDDGACGHYRMIEPLTFMARHGHETLLISKGIGPEKVEQAMAESNVLFFQRPTRLSHYEFVAATQKDPNRLTVFEHDDNPWDIDEFNDAYRSHGTQEVAFPAAQVKEKYPDIYAAHKHKEKNGLLWMWKDGEAGFDIRKNIESINLFMSSLLASDIVTTTTPKLASVYRKEMKRLGHPNPQVYVMPNSLDLRRWEPVEIVKPKDEVRLLWSGGASHFSDWVAMEGVLEEIFDRFPSVTLHVLGVLYPAAVKNLDPKRVVQNSLWTGFEAHSFRLATAGADIGLIPLFENEFAKSKSDLKFCEYSALKMATVAQDCLPYSVSIKDGETGFLAKTKEEWVEKLSALIGSVSLRKEMAANARTWVEGNRDIDKNWVIWEKAFHDGLKKKRKRLLVKDKAQPKSKTKKPKPQVQKA